MVYGGGRLSADSAKRGCVNFDRSVDASDMFDVLMLMLPIPPPWNIICGGWERRGCKVYVIFDLVSMYVSDE